MKVIIAGSRGFSNFQLLKDKCDEIIGDSKDVEIVSGGARGADKMGEFYGASKGYKIKQFPANWDLYGKSAGYKRNSEMAEYSNVLICFWDGTSRGTENMIKIAKERGLEVHVIQYK